MIFLLFFWLNNTCKKNVRLTMLSVIPGVYVSLLSPVSFFCAGCSCVVSGFGQTIVLNQIKSNPNQIKLYLKLRNYRHGKTWRYKNERNFAYTHTFST
jgi:hypothetical protein